MSIHVIFLQILTSCFRLIISSKSKHRELPFHHHFHNKGLQSIHGLEIEHYYLNPDAVRSLPVGTGLGREKREVGEEEGMLTFTQTLSKNVTRILEELLMGYDQTERPPSQGDIFLMVIVIF